MSKLLHAGLRKGLRSISLWLCLSSSALLGIVQALNTRSVEYLDDIYVLPFFVILSVAISLFIGAEHSDGAIRNKTVVGHGRASVYFSNLILCLAFTFVAALLYLGSFSALMVGHIGVFPAYALMLSALGFLLVSLSYTSILVAVSMMISHKAFNAVICILLVLATIFLVYMIHDALSQAEFIMKEISYSDGTLTEVKEPNPRYVGGTARKVAEVVLMIIPYGAMIEYIEIIDSCFMPINIALELSAESTATLRTLPLYSVAVSVFVGATGWLFFRKKGLK